MNDAIRLSPRDGFMPFWLTGLYWAYHSLQDYEDAANVALRGVRIAPRNPTFRRQLTAAYYMLGRTDEAREALDDYLDLEPGATAAIVRYIPSRNKQHLERFVEALRKAGLPD